MEDRNTKPQQLKQKKGELEYETTAITVKTA